MVRTYFCVPLSRATQKCLQKSLFFMRVTHPHKKIQFLCADNYVVRMQNQKSEKNKKIKVCHRAPPAVATGSAWGMALPLPLLPLASSAGSSCRCCCIHRCRGWGAPDLLRCLEASPQSPFESSQLSPALDPLLPRLGVSDPSCCLEASP